MHTIFSRVFWGFILVLFDFNFSTDAVSFDFIPDPIGYFLIFKGLSALLKNYQQAQIGVRISLLLIFLSIPSMFIDENVANETSQYWMSSWGWMYSDLLHVIHVTLVFYVFKVMVTIATQFEDNYLLNRTVNTMRWYIGINVVVLILSPFFKNIPVDIMFGMIFVLGIIAFVMEIIFLVLLRRFMKVNIDISG
ncbi:hypothetical protein NC661_17060 [Aquibacillus koreensis]|uniref:Uncharacterized protein n=1 Tax=Aquibacillus koreensis TaxID=279446 RepID=A0A9X3WR10_9BACI|nr:hypothetical protein [Aquibacillus koreensis]MCT2536146.1 hypothetical protein [Aquibacillus koreensis]MDC3422071.1 hypothetical protein [Aquibacillus koreensis]